MQASEATIIYGSRYNQPEPSVSYAEDTCDIIMYLFSGTGVYENARNLFEDDTTRNNILDWTETFENAYDYATVFHYGHMAPQYEDGWWQWWDGATWWSWSESVKHYAYLDDDGVVVEDLDIHPYTYQEEHYFVFLWTCVNGETCGYYDDDYYASWDLWWEGTGAVGMPFAWMHQSGLSSDGYANADSSDYCFIGFENISRWLNDTAPNTNTKTYGDFVVGFYYHALNSTENLSINQALDRASRDFWLDYNINNFGDTELYNGYSVWFQGQWWWSKMRIWGNGDNILPN